MKKLIFQKLTADLSIFFITSLCIIGLIVWTIQAVNYLDYVTKDGHGFKVYIFYTIYNFPKIIHRIVPFILFISLFYTISNYEKNNQLNIFWLNGISKISFANILISFSIVIMLLQIILGGIISPISQYKAREYLKNSNIDFFSSLIKEGKFINITRGLTIFINKKNDDGTYSKIFLDESKNDSSKMIYAKGGYLVDNDKKKSFKLLDGSVVDNRNLKSNIFSFDEIDFNLKNQDTNTITIPKIQEINSLELYNCLIKKNNINKNIINCDNNLKKEIKRELLKRLHKPLYIPVIVLLTSFLIIFSKSNEHYEKFNKIIFLIVFIQYINITKKATQ